jgi:hypothetical protein
MTAVNTAGTYRLDGAVLSVSTHELEIAAVSMALEADANYASHPRTGGSAPFEEYIDATYTLELSYAQGFGTDGIQTVFAALEGTESVWVLKTGGATVSATLPKFTFNAVVPALSPLPSTAWGEFAEGSITIPIKGVPVKATT